MYSLVNFLKSGRSSNKLGNYTWIVQRTFSSKDGKDPPSGNPVEAGDNSEGNESTSETEKKTYSLYPEQRLETPPKTRNLIDIFRDDIAQYKRYFKDPKNNTFFRPVYPNNVDYLVIGAGPIGATIAFFLKKIGPNSSVLILDKDISANQFKMNEKMINVIPQLSLGHLTQQFQLKENMQLARFAAEFVRELPSYLTEFEDVEGVTFRPFGHLTLASKKGVESLKENHILQSKYQVHTELMTAFQLGQRFPWLNTNDIAFGNHGLLNEGWFNPWEYLLSIRTGAMRKGAWFVEAEPLEFLYRDDVEMNLEGFQPGEYQLCDSVIVRESNGNMKRIEFAICIVALEEGAGEFTKNMLHISKENQSMFQFEFPIEKRKRYIYCFDAPDGGPGLSSPMIHDPTGLFFRREGLGNTFICGCPPIPSEEPKADNLEPDVDYFTNRVWPLLANRVPLFERVNLRSVHAYFEDCNTFDGSPIVGTHPAYHNFFFANAFGNKAYQYAPGIGKATAELLISGYFDTIDLTRFNFNRVVQEQPLFEKFVL